jgi:hypothetical protein
MLTANFSLTSTRWGRGYTVVERRWVISLALFVMLLTSLPYLLGYATQGDSWRFTGFVFGVEDGNSYIAKMMSGQAGSWLFRTPYTAEDQRGIVAFLPYLLLGKLAAPPGVHEQLVALFHLFRLGAGILAILATYDFIAFFVPGTGWRRLGTLLVVLGGGLGWVLILIGQGNWLGSLPLDFYSPETFGFLSIYGIPHLALARAALLWGLLWYLREASEAGHPRLRAAAATGAVWLLAALAQPLEAVVLGYAVILYLVVRLIEIGLASVNKRPQDWTGIQGALLLAVWSGTVPGLFTLYTVIAFRTDPFLVAWTAQNIIKSPQPLHYLAAYGLLLPFSLVGVLHPPADHQTQDYFLAAWAVSLPLLAYLPFNLQRRLPEGIWVALVILAVWGFQRLAGDRLEKPMREFKLVWVTVVCFGSTLFLLAGGLLAAKRPSMPVFRPVAEVEAFDFLASTAKPGDVVLGAYESGNVLPSWAPVRVLIGHGPESVGLAELQPQVERFYTSQSTDEERLALLHQYHVRYVFWGPAERSLGAWNPDLATYLRKIYQENEYSVYAFVE